MLKLPGGVRAIAAITNACATYDYSHDVSQTVRWYPYRDGLDGFWLNFQPWTNKALWAVERGMPQAQGLFWAADKIEQNIMKIVVENKRR